jgi:transcriptional regulatory protein LevR
MITEIVLKIFSKYSQHYKGFINNLSKNEYTSKFPIGDKLKQSMQITIKHSEGAYIALLITR